MKKVVLTFVLLLTVSFAFAGNEIEKTLTFDQVKETLTNAKTTQLPEVNLSAEAIVFRCCSASSDGIKVTVCGGGNECTRAGKMLDKLQ